jgi:hypothetical protein
VAKSYRIVSLTSRQIEKIALVVLICSVTIRTGSRGCHGCGRRARMRKTSEVLLGAGGAGLEWSFEARLFWCEIAAKAKK